jgi:hypothetical protein
MSPNSRRLGTVDLDTGEMLEGGVAVWVGAKVKSHYGRRWYMQSQEAVEALAKDKDLAGRPTRVLLFLLSRLDFENYVHLPQTEIMAALDLHAPDVSKAMALLQKKGILVRGPRVGHSFGYRLNPNFGWKGKVKNLNEERTRRLRAVK